MSVARISLALALVGVVAAWLTTSLCIVQPGEVVVVRRLGRIAVGHWAPGLHLGWPAPLEARDRVRIDQVRRVEVGPLPEAGESADEPGEFLTADQNLIVARGAIQFRVSDPAAFVLTCSDPQFGLSRLAEAALARVLARFPAEALLREGRSAAESSILASLASAVERLALGVEILSVQLETLRPPPEVAADFAAAQSAASDRQRRVREGDIEAARRRASAQSEAALLVDSARSKAADRLAEARGRAARFRALLASYHLEPHLTRRRLYLEALAEIFRSLRRKLILPSDAPIDLGLTTP